MVPHMAPRAVQNCIFTAWLGRYPAAIRIATSPTSCGSSCSNTAKVVATSCSWRPNATPMARPSVKLCVASATRLRNAALCSPQLGRATACANKRRGCENRLALTILRRFPMLSALLLAKATGCASRACQRELSRLACWNGHGRENGQGRRPSRPALFCQ